MLRQFATHFQAFRQRRADFRALQLLDDHYLADIGLTRADISMAVRHGRR